MSDPMLGMGDKELIAFHRKLLNAPERMRLYRQAIHAVVRPGDVVIDLGCGSGILGLFACQAGAERVYAIERSAAINLAKELAKANGFADRIIYLNQDIRKIQLDKKADLIVSELISKGVLGQKMAETVGWCRDNLLQPGGRIIPAEVELLAAPVEDEAIYRKIQLPKTAEYGIDFSAMARQSSNIPLSAHIPPEALLAPGQTGYHYQATTAPASDHVAATLEFRIARPGMLHGFALWFSSILADGIVIANTPPGIAAWDNLFLPLDRPISVQTGMVVRLTINGRDDSNMPSLWAWNTDVMNGADIFCSQKQSTFFAQLAKS